MKILASFSGSVANIRSSLIVDPGKPEVMIAKSPMTTYQVPLSLSGVADDADLIHGNRIPEIVRIASVEMGADW